MTYKEYIIPKKNGKIRKIVAPDDELKAYLRGELPRLTKFYFQYARMFGVKDNIHGFIPKKNCKTAAAIHKGFNLTIMMDIKEFFDSVTRAHLPKSLCTPEMFHKDGYTAQGFPTSPILANIAITPIIAKIKFLLNKKYFNKFAITIYADDIQISLNSDVKTDIADVISIVSNEFQKKSFVINKTKTRVRYSSFGQRRILGINVGETLQPTRATRRKMRAAKHQGNKSSLGGHTSWANYISR